MKHSFLTRLTSALFAVLMVFTAIPATILTVWGEAMDGFGDYLAEQAPEKDNVTTFIYTAEDLDNIRNDLDGFYILMNDIDLSGREWVPIGDKDHPFTGTLLGSSYIISGMTISNLEGIAPASDGFYYLGLLGYHTGVIRDLVLESSVTADVSGKNAYVGSFAGYNAGKVLNCYDNMTKVYDLDTYTGDKNLTVGDCHTIMLKGSGGTYTGYTITVAETAFSGVTIILRDVNLTNCTIKASGNVDADVCIISYGTSNSISGVANSTTQTHAATVNLPKSKVSVLGSAPLDVYGGNGSTSTSLGVSHPGLMALVASDLYVKMDGCILTLCGGSGGRGLARTSSSLSTSTTFAALSALVCGGQGTRAIRTSSIIAVSEVDLSSGDGGTGGLFNYKIFGSSYLKIGGNGGNTVEPVDLSKTTIVGKARLFVGLPGRSGQGSFGMDGIREASWTEKTIDTVSGTVYTTDLNGKMTEETTEIVEPVMPAQPIYGYHTPNAAATLNLTRWDRTSSNYTQGSAGMTEYEGALYYGPAENPYAVLVRWIATERTICEIHPDTEYIYTGAFYVVNDSGVHVENRLTTVEIPKSVDAIGKAAFYRCKRLTSVVAKDVLVDVGREAFAECTSLTSVEWKDAPEKPLIDLGRYEKKYLDLTYNDQGELRLGYGVFAGCTSLTSIRIPEGVTEIPAMAFRGATKLQSVDFAESTTVIWREAFAGCERLEAADLGKMSALTAIKDHAFDGCTSLKSIYIPGTVQTIGEDVFENCSELERIEGQADAVYYPVIDHCLYEIDDPEAAEDARTYTLIKGCENSLITQHPEFLNDADADGFNVITVSGVRKHAFYNVDFNAPIAVPKNVVLEDDAFVNCSGEIIILPTTYNVNGFKNCDAGSLFTYSEPTADNQYRILLDGQLGESVYYIVYANKIDAEAVILVYGIGATYDYAVHKTIENDKILITSAVFDAQGKELPKALLSEELARDGTEIQVMGYVPKYLVIRDGVETIGTSVFYGMEPYLESIQLGEGLKKISAKAFDFTHGSTIALRNVTFEGDCPQIDQDAFLFHHSATALSELLVFTYDQDAAGWTYNGMPYTYYVEGQGLVTQKPDDPSARCFMVTGSENINYVNTAGYDKYGIQYALLGEEQYVDQGGKTKTVLTAQVIGYKATANGDKTIQIPHKILMNGNFYYVVSVAQDAFKDNTVLEQITIQTDVTADFIEDGESYGFDGVSSIHSGAFANCSALLYFVGDKLATLDEDAFTGVDYIVVNPATETHGWSTVIGQSTNVYTSRVLSGYTDADGIYYTVDLKNRTAIVGKKSDNSEESIANTSMSKKANVVIPEFVTYNDRLYKVVGFDRYAFYNNKSLESITISRFIGEGQTEAAPAIWDCTFRNTENLWQILVDYDNKYYQADGSMLLGNPLQAGEDQTIFTRLIKYPEGDNRPTLIVPDQVTVIENYAVAGNAYLKCVRLDDVTVVGSHAFWNCTNLDTLEGDYQLHDIGDSAFENTALKGIKFTDALATIGTRAFYNTDLEGTVELSAYAVQIGDSAFGRCSEITDFKFVDFGSGHPWPNNYDNSYWTVDGVLFGYTLTNSGTRVKTLLQYPASDTSKTDYDMSALAEDTVPVAIATEAFWGSKYLTKIRMHDRTALVGSQAFANCNRLTYVKLGADYRGSGDETTGQAGVFSYNLFVDSPALEEIEVAEQNQYFCHDSNGVLFSKALDVLYCYPAAVQRVNYRVPASVTKVYDSAFYGNTNIKQIVFNTTEPLSIGSRAFGSCSSLTEVYYITETVPTVGEKIYDNTPMRLQTLFKEEFQTRGWAAAVANSKWCERNIAAYRTIGTVPNATLKTNDYLLNLVGTDGAPLQDVYVIVTTYVESDLIDAWVPHKFYLHTDENGQVVFSTLDSDAQVRADIHVYAQKEGYFPYDYDLYIDTDMLISYLTLTKEPDVFGVSCEDRDIQSQTIDLNLQLRLEECGVTSFVNGEFITQDAETTYSDIPITVLGFWDSNCTDPVFTLKQGDRILPATQEVNGRACTFVVSSEHLVPNRPICATITVRHGEEVLEMTKTLNINVNKFDFSKNDVNTDASSEFKMSDLPNWLEAIVNSGSLEFKVNDSVKLGMDIELTESEVLISIDADFSKTFQTSVPLKDAKAGYEKYYKNGKGTYFFRIIDLEKGLTYAIRFAPSAQDTYTYYRLQVYPTALGRPTKADDKSVVYGAFNESKFMQSLPEGRIKYEAKAYVIKTAASLWLTENGKDSPTQFLNGKTVDLTGFKAPYEEYARPKDKYSTDLTQKFGLNIGGQLALGYSGEDGLTVKSGKIYGYITYQLEHNIYFSIGVVPVVLTIELNGKGGVVATLAPDTSGKWSFRDLALRAEVDIEVSFGLNLAIASGGIYGKLGFVVNYVILPEENMTELAFSGELGVYVKVWHFKYRLSIFKGTYDCLTGNWDKEHIWDRFNASLYMPELYEYGEDCNIDARLAYIDGELYQFYFASVTDAQYDQYNSTKLMYSVYDATEDTWSEGVPVDDNGYTDTSYIVYRHDGRVYVAYTQQTKKLDENSANDTYQTCEGLSLKCIEVTEMLNGAQPDTVLDGKASPEYKYLLQIGSMNGAPIVVWAENADNNVFGTSPDNYYDEQTGESYVFETTANSIHYAKLENGVWVEQEYVIDGLSSVTDMALDGSMLYYVIDTDADLADNADSVLYCVDLADGSHTTTTVSGVSSVECTDGNVTYYYANESCLASPDQELALPMQGKFSAGYLPLTDANGDLIAMIYQGSKNWEKDGKTETCSVMYAVFNENGTWGAPVEIYSPDQADRYVTGYDAIRLTDGRLMLAMQICDADGNTVDHVTEFYDPDKVNFDYTYEIDYENQQILYTVTNLGGQSASFSLERGESATVASGESAVLVYQMDKRVGDTEATLKVRASRDGVVLRTLEKGTVSTAYVDLVPLSKQLVIGENNTMLIGVRNYGNITSKGGTLYILSGEIASEYVLDAQREQKLIESAIYSVDLPEIGAGRLAYFELQLDESLVTGGDGVISMFVVPNGDEPQACIENNLDAIYLDEITQTTYGEQPEPVEPAPELSLTLDTFYKYSEEQPVPAVGIDVTVIGKNTGDISLMLGDTLLTPGDLTGEGQNDYGIVEHGTYSRTLRIRPEYLNGLEVGEHTFKVIVGGVELLFTVNVKEFEIKQPVTYEVKFVYADGEKIFTLPTEQEEYAAFFDSIPRGSDQFLGWDSDNDGQPDEFSYAEKETVYTALYRQELVTYVVTWVLADGLNVTKSYAEGSIPVCPQTSYKGQVIRGWTTAEGETVDPIPAVNGPATYYAVYDAKVNTLLLIGSPTVGGALQADLASIGWEELTDLKYQWYLDGVSITDADKDTLDVLGEMKGKTVWLIVTDSEGRMAQSEPLEVSTHAHTMFFYAYTAPSCTVGGNVAYWFCPVCDICYLDADCIKQIGADQVWLAPIGHKYYDVVTDPTCLSQGYTTHTCKNCDHTVIDTYIEATGHSMSDWAEIKPATCTENGLEASKCEHCDYSETRVIDALGHAYEADWTVDVEATCISAGSKSRHCTRCAAVTDVTVIEIQPHSLSEWAESKTATCTENGLETRKCEQCDYNETRVIEALGHDYSDEWTTDLEATCISAGSKSHHCTRCDAVTDVTVLEILPHRLSEWTLDKAPTCTENGIETRQCTNGDYCSYNETRIIDALGHEYESHWTVDVEATCISAGSESRHCERCDAVTDVQLVPITEHSMSEWRSTKEATCTHTGLEYRECAYCPYNETRVIAALDHKYQAEWTVDVEATCTFAGSKSHHCERCDAVTDVTVIPILDHEMSVWAETKPATCTENGLEYRKCAHCSYNETRTLEALGHNFAEEWTVDVEATCTSAGSKSRHCVRCDATADVQSIALTEHRYDGGKVTAPAEPDREGIRTTTCLDCGYAYTESIEKSAPEMVEQSATVWNSWSKKDELVFRSNAAFEDFVELRINGEVVPADCYTVIKGSIKIVMDPEYVASLQNGDYTVDIVSKNGVASSTFKVEKKTVTNPWFAVCCVSGMTLLAVAAGFVLAIIRKRRGLQ